MGSELAIQFKEIWEDQILRRPTEAKEVIRHIIQTLAPHLRRKLGSSIGYRELYQMNDVCYYTPAYMCDRQDCDNQRRHWRKITTAAITPLGYPEEGNVINERITEYRGEPSDEAMIYVGKHWNLPRICQGHQYVMLAEAMDDVIHGLFKAGMTQTQMQQIYMQLYMKCNVIQARIISTIWNLRQREQYMLQIIAHLANDNSIPVTVLDIPRKLGENRHD